MENDGSKHGARIYGLNTGTVLIKQTIKSGPKYTDEYVVDTRPDGSHIEEHVDWDDDARIASALRRALQGTL